MELALTESTNDKLVSGFMGFVTHVRCHQICFSVFTCPVVHSRDPGSMSSRVNSGGVQLQRSTLSLSSFVPMFLTGDSVQNRSY